MTSSEFEVKKIKWLETAKTKKGIMNNDIIYNVWTDFINNDMYKK